eukprot:4356377-Amphidinium_carterae.1
MQGGTGPKEGNAWSTGAQTNTCPSGRSHVTPNCGHGCTLPVDLKKVSQGFRGQPENGWHHYCQPLPRREGETLWCMDLRTGG